ncbi:hypothetical protein LIER_42374 [Lithospermum erythrorhizon]|uniref:Uncharacterized protein n=1 Tax=Lithospermum erythrorhizon TaxID=34254 RepID=A0AAV3RQK5_LITER
MPSGPKKRRAAAKKKGKAIPNSDGGIIISNLNTTTCHDFVHQQDVNMKSQGSEKPVQEIESNMSDMVQGDQATGDNDNGEDVMKPKYLEGSLSYDDCIAKVCCIEEKVMELVEGMNKFHSSLSEVLLSIEMLKA